MDPPEGYCYQSSIVIDTARQNHPVKWQPIRKEGKWSSSAYLGHGNGLLWREDIPHNSIWDWTGEKARCGEGLRQEAIRIDTGLFIGNRDTEQRLAKVVPLSTLMEKTPGRAEVMWLKGCAVRMGERIVISA